MNQVHLFAEIDVGFYSIKKPSFSGKILYLSRIFFFHLCILYNNGLAQLGSLKDKDFQVDFTSPHKSAWHNFNPLHNLRDS